jgi:hypothetical protein
MDKWRLDGAAQRPPGRERCDLIGPDLLKVL